MSKAPSRNAGRLASPADVRSTRGGKAHSKPATVSTVRTGTADPLAAAGLLEAAGQLAMVTVEVDPADLPDLVATGGLEGCRLWRNESEVLVGIGESLRLPLRGGLVSDTNVGLVGKALASMVSENPLQLPGTGPLAIGALPYDPCEPGWLSVPRLVLGHRQGRCWVTMATHLDQRSSGDAPGALAGDWRRLVQETLAQLPGTSDGVLPGSDGALSGNHQGPDRFELAATLPHTEWKRLVAAAATAIEKGEFTKVVIGRRVEVRANQPFAMDEVLSRLAALYPSCSIFHVEGFVGASPEMLVRKTGSQVWSHPLAGTVARSGDTATDRALEDAMLASAKDRLEHQVVVDAIATALAPWCASLDVPSEPSVVALRNVSHLGTLLHGQLAWHPSGLPTSLELAALLQPTPAVGGLPVAAAVAWQRANEGFPRGRYAGPVGWIDARGDGEWALGLRSADISGCNAYLYAGAGIVAGSDPDTELAETQLKLQALLAALVRP